MLKGKQSSDGYRFFGAFEVLLKMELPRTEVTGFYEGFHSSFYEELVAADDWDLPSYRRLAHETGGPVLELGCGGGRLTVPLAQDGHEILGLDLSKDMLRLLRRKLAGEPVAVRDRVRMELADMTSFDLGGRFGLIFLPATNVCLLHTDDRRRALFEHVVDHLSPGGLFAFDFLVPDEARLAQQNDRVEIYPGIAPYGKRFTMMGQLYVPEDEVQVLNCYSEVVDKQGVTRRFLGSTAKAVLPEERYFDLLSGAGLEVVRVEDEELSDHAGKPYLVKLVVCRR